MTTIVTIVEIKTRKVVGHYRINLRGLNYAPSQDECIAEAWRAAVEDKAVNAGDKQKYKFTLK